MIQITIELIRFAASLVESQIAGIVIGATLTWAGSSLHHHFSRKHQLKDGVRSAYEELTVASARLKAAINTYKYSVPLNDERREALTELVEKRLTDVRACTARPGMLEKNELRERLCDQIESDSVGMVRTLLTTPRIDENIEAQIHFAKCVTGIENSMRCIRKSF